MKVTLLGTGSPEATTRRASSGYLVETGNQTLLFDCGGGVFDRLLHAGHGSDAPTALFFSHLHSDHMMDYARLIHARWDMKAPNLPVYAPAPFATISERLFGADGAFAFDLTARTELPQSLRVWAERGGHLPRPWPAPQITEIAPGWSMNGDGYRIEAIEVPHAQPFLTCLAFAIEAEGKRVVYAGDSGHTPALEAFVKGADLLIHWCYRMSHEPLPHPDFAATSPGHLETAKLAARAGVRHLILTHLRPQHDDPAIHDRVRNEVAAIYDGPFALAEDLEVITLA